MIFMENILLETIGSVAVIRLNTPPLNLQTLDCMRRLGDIVRELAVSSVRAIVLTGEGGRVFCAGSDIKEFPSLCGNFVEEKLRNENYVFDGFSELPIPSVCAITGSALGGGLELAMCCDFRIMSESATLSTPEINLGNFPGSGGPFRLVRSIGAARAKEMMSLAGTVSAEQALKYGLVNEVVPAESVTQRAIELAAELAEKPPEILAAIKELVMASAYETTAQAQAHARRLYLKTIRRI